MTSTSIESSRAPTSTRQAEIGLRRSELRGDLFGLGILFVALVPTLTIVLALTHSDLDVPWTYESDAVLTLMLIKNVVLRGWYLTSDLLGAPFGQELYDFPVPGDVINFVVFRAMAALGIGVPRIINLFYLGTFFAVSASAYFVLRILRFRVWIAITLAYVYAIVPDHFHRGQIHLLLAGYHAVPIAVLILYLQLREAPWLETRFAAWRSRRGVLMTLACVLIAGSGFYYAFFFILLLGMGSVLRGLVDRSWRPVAGAALVGGLVVGLIAVANVNVIAYQREHGANPAVAKREAAEAEIYGLKAHNLFLPIEGHRIGAMEVLRDRVGETFFPSEKGEPLGLILSVGLVLLLGSTARRVLRGDVEATARSELMGTASLGTAIAFFFALIGGASLLFGIVGFTQIRAWNRIGFYIAFFAVLALATALERIGERIPILSRRGGMALASCGIMAFAAFDQTSISDAPRHAAVASEFRSDAAFVAQIEDRIGEDASIFQLPYMPFPENGPVGETEDYDHLRGYLHSDTLRWSYGGIKGREADWQANVSTTRPARLMADLLAVVGFDAIYVDRAGLPASDPDLEQQLREVLGEPAVADRSGRFAVYSLRAAQSEIRSLLTASATRELRAQVLLPVRLVVGEGFYQPEANETQTWRWTSAESRLVVENPGSQAVPVTLHLEVDAREEASLAVHFPGGETELTLGPRPQAR